MATKKAPKRSKNKDPRKSSHVQEQSTKRPAKVQRKRAQDEIKALKQQIEFVLGVTKTGLDIIDSEFNIRYIDPEWAKDYGNPAGKKCYEYFMGKKEVCSNCGVSEALKTKKPVISEEVLAKEDNRPIQVTTIPFKNELGEWLVAEVNVDITERKKMEETLRESEEKYRRVVEYANQGIGIAQDRMIKFANPKMVKIFGYSKEELCAKPFREFIYREDREMVRERHLKRLQREEIPRIYDFRIVDKDGNIKWLEISASLITWKDRPATLIFLGDITERKSIEEALRESEEKYRQVVENANQGILIAQDAMVKFSNPKMVEMSGYSQEEVYSKFFTEFIHPDDREMVAERYLKRLEGKEVTPVYDFRIVDKDGNIKWLEIRSTLFLWDGRPATLNFLSDISKRKEAEDKVRIYQAQLRSLGSEISLIEARERRDIAADLHDHIGQNLAVAKIKLGELREMASSSKFVDYVDKIREYVEESIEFTRSLTFEISPPILYELGFEAAVEWLIEQMQEQHKIQIEFEADTQSQPMSEEVRVFLFKATKELLVNIVKHAQAKKAKVSIRKDNDNIRILVMDDGVGFHSYKDKQFSKESGFGLFSISERVKNLGGHIEIESTPGQGTRITLVASLGQKENNEGRGR